VYALRVECLREDKDLLVAELCDRGTAGIMEEDLAGGRCRLRAFFATPYEMTGGSWEWEEPKDWVAESQALWAPLVVGERFFLVPAWRDDPTPPGRLRLEFQTGTVCGTGWHPTTQLSLEALERQVRPGATVLDVGAGSGILSMGAALLGAGRVIACDIDPAAVATACERCLQARFFVGSARSVRSGSIDVLVANINAEALIQLAREIIRVLKPGGRAILSGFPARHLERVQAAFQVREVLTQEEWAAVVC
jgi:ribosomal protein L11 methyltransferase